MTGHCSSWMPAVVLVLLALGAPAWGAARGGRSDLNTGEVFPSDNGALFENPGALPQSATAFEGLVGLESDLTAEVSLVGSGRRLGWGLGAIYLSSSNQEAFGGLGLGTGEMGLGLTGLYDIDSKSFDADAGLQFGGKSGLGFAAVARGLNGGPDEYVGGVGYRQAGRFQLEADLLYFPVAGGDDRIDLSPGLSVNVTGAFSLMVGYAIRVQPSVGGGKFEAGAALRLGSRVALEYLYQQPIRPEHSVGAKIAL